MNVPAQRSEWLADVTAADWIAPHLHPFLQDTGSVVPAGFDAYCRVFHPIDGDRSWSEVARSNRRIAHSQMQLHLISAPPGEQGDRYSANVSWGSLPAAQCEALVGVLREHTNTPDRCWLAVWEGYGGLDTGNVAARVQLPNRSYLLATGPVEAATEPLPFVDRFAWTQSPNLWWPDDRAWIVVTEIDYAWTYVGGSRAAIDAVTEHGDIEALPALLGDLPFFDADARNAALDE